ncbi:Major facilitator superfamily domain-containing protein 1-like [Oopsacas minuta]|uniref:Lysosomal dipeptide transporter MFSD1 n=1 Tax=Oopsacas minuta TaxID=111878 RepID=A0AAV7J826_9METZ|nr:Major facilitator superfamily domain-containing protein 1-like [Oopsacas minuta]
MDSESTRLLGTSQEEKKQQNWFLREFTHPTDPSTLLHRLIILFFMCTLSFGSYFCFDNPASLEGPMLKTLSIDKTRYELFYSLYSWPNVILSVIGGYLLDRVFGHRLGAVIFSSLLCIGQLIFAAGAHFGSFPVMCVGRFVFGLGGESLTVTQNTYAVIWFKGKEFSFVFGLLISVSRLGSTFNMLTLGPLFKKMVDSHFSGFTALGICLDVGLVICILSLLGAVVLGLLDKRAEKLVENRIVKSEEPIRLKDILHFPLSLWVIFFICVFYYSAVFPFISLGLVFFQQKYGEGSVLASSTNSAVYIVSAVASPFCGFVIDKTGLAIFWVLLGTLLTLAAHSMLAFTFILPLGIMILMGLSYSILASSLWPLVGYLVQENALGTAYGIMQAIQNAGLAIISIVAGVLLDQYGYLVLELFFCMCLCVTLLFCLTLYFLDLGNAGILNRTSCSKKKAERLEQVKDDLYGDREDEDEDSLRDESLRKRVLLNEK